MTMEELDLLEAIRELRTASADMTSGQLPSADQMERYQRALDWADKVIERAERARRFEV